MAKPWDDTLKKLIRANPPAFVQWLLPHANYVRELPYVLEHEELEVDALLEVVINHKHMLLHIEFQTYNEKSMRERLLRYNVLARMKYDLPVLSCVIYLLNDGEIETTLLIWDVPSGHEVLIFRFVNVELSKLTVGELLQLHLVGLLPLLPLTKDGENRNMVKRMFQEIESAEGIEEKARKDLELIGYTLASLVFKRNNKTELDWLIRSFREMHEILRDTPIFQEILQEGREEGREAGLEQGRLEEARDMLLVMINARFPRLKKIAREQIQQIEDVQVLRRLAFQIVATQKLNDAKQYLLNWREPEQDN